MKDETDKQTAELPLNGNVPKKRGRPSTGKAMTNAEKQRAYRERQKSNVTGLALTDSETTAIVTLLQDKAKAIAYGSMKNGPVMPGTREMETVEWLHDLARKIASAKR